MVFGCFQDTHFSGLLWRPLRGCNSLQLQCSAAGLSSFSVANSCFRGNFLTRDGAAEDATSPSGFECFIPSCHDWVWWRIQQARGFQRLPCKREVCHHFLLEHRNSEGASTANCWALGLESGETPLGWHRWHTFTQFFSAFRSFWI